MSNHYKSGYLWRKAERQFAQYCGERRGRPAEIDGERAISGFVELGARARIVSRGKLNPFLADPRLRLVRGDEKRARLSSADRERFRKRYQIGKLELESWRNIRCHYGYPGPAPKPADSGEPHTVYHDIIRRVEARVAELKVDREALFFLTDM